MSPSFPLDPKEFLISGFDITNSHFIFFVKRWKHRDDYEDDQPREWSDSEEDEEEEDETKHDRKQKKQTKKLFQEEELCRFRYRLLRPQIYAHLNIIYDYEYWESTCDDYFQKLTPHWGYVDSFSSSSGKSEMELAKMGLERKKERQRERERERATMNIKG
uniref:Uncharacterized protein n=1 Tax=Paramoeba aestuarina TaxID=180227 RepID=A0A7S4KBI8_9EUKA